MRFLKSDPVPDDLLETVLYAATRASSPNNSQGWTFVVVRDAEQRRAIGEAFGFFAGVVKDMPAPEDPTDRRTLIGAFNLSSTIGQVPIVIFVCVRNIYPPDAPDEQMMWSAGFAASQNLVVAARSLGLGTVFSTLHKVAEPQIRSILNLPEDVKLATTIPVGWPGQSFGPVTRKSLDDVVRYDRYA
jgi:nitroreductase